MSRIQDVLESHFGTHVDQDDAPLIIALEDGVRAEAALVVTRYQIERAVAMLKEGADHIEGVIAQLEAYLAE